MTLRDKYRKCKQWYMLKIMGVHPQNRGGRYPQGRVTRSLGVESGVGGFSAEEANRMGVCVEEIPPHERNGDPTYRDQPYETYFEMNKRKAHRRRRAGHVLRGQS